jgi:uncharacterized membrane protein YecN with MAPEG domain
MMEEELIKIWQSSPNQERIKFEKSRLMLDMQSSIDRLHRKIRYRDLREYIAAAIVIPAFAYSAYVIPNLVTKIGSVLVIGYAVFIILMLRNARKHKPSAFTETYLQYLHKTKRYILIQKKLLDNVLYWYILPGMTLTMLCTLGFGIAGRTRFLIKMAVMNVVLAIATYYLNKRAIEKEFAPRLAKIEELIRVLEKG